MNILIKGMKMPKSCNNCNFQCFTEWGGDSPYANEIATKCLVTDKFVFPSDSERDENCPLIELPPHGRLVDIDEVDREYNKGYVHKIYDFSGFPTIIDVEGEDDNN